MKATPATSYWAGPASLALTAITGVYVWYVAAGQNLPVVPGYGPAFFVLWFMGLAMHVLSGMRDNARANTQVLGRAMLPLALLGIGTFLLLIAAPIANWLGLIAGYQGAFYLLASLIAVKWVLAHLHFLRR
jgi:hypothetical protein